jgi:hypothetical protein
LASPASSQTTSFAGRYTLRLTFGPACRAGVGAVSVLLNLTEATVAGGTELDGRPTPPDEVKVAQLSALRSAGRLHGPFATLGSRSAREPITTDEGLLLSPWLMLDGTVTTGSGRPTARGSAIGFVALGRADEDVPSSLANCTASDFTWTLDPQ